MKKTHLFITAITFVAASITSCKKENDTPPATTTTVAAPVVTGTTKLCGKTVKLSAWTSAPAWYSKTDIFAVTDTCLKDNTIVYSTDGTYVFDEGGKKCKAGDPQSKTGTWAFSANETILTLMLAPDTVVYSVLINNDTVLKLQAPYTDTLSTPHKTLIFTTTYKKKPI